MDLSIAREESPAPATKKTLLKSKVFSFFAIHDLRVPEVRLRPPPVADTGSKTKRCGRTTRHAPSERVFGHRKRSSEQSSRDNWFKVSAAASVGASVLCTEVSTGHPHPAPATKNGNSHPCGGCFRFSLETNRT